MTALIQFHQHGLYVACMWLAKLVQLPVAMHLRRRGGEGSGNFLSQEKRGMVPSVAPLLYAPLISPSHNLVMLVGNSCNHSCLHCVCTWVSHDAVVRRDVRCQH